MKIVDMHIHSHANGLKPNPDLLIGNMSKAGIFGGAVFSISPGVPPFSNIPPISQRVSDVLEWVKGYEDRLFPVLYIHPDEENVIEEVKKASERGIVAYKMICNTYYVYEQKSMDLLSCIAELEKPVIFHSGILWDGKVSSQYNKPVNWEALLEIPKLKFSMGHCSWPWYDECIALYGKILNAYYRDPKNSCEMFFDITPGTPEIYRKDLLTKLFTIGYDVPHNIIFGTDCVASNYNFNWTLKWLKKDNEIMDELGVSDKIREWIYYDNFLRFIGKKPKDFTHISPIADSLNSWRLENEL